ncbi:MAG TPA: phosphotransferase [Vicinamibacterales bacterium]|nr:phosphotransferase [Vicinamibacterales bacterium]
MNDERAPDPDQTAALIRGQFPQLAPVTVRYLGEGYDSTAFDVNGRWVFRFPKRVDVEQQLLTELRFLPRLVATPPPVPIPEYRFRGVPSAEFPRHFAGYARLLGAPGIRHVPSAHDFQRLAPALGRFLSWLHRFPIREALRLEVPDQRSDTLADEIRAEALADFPALGRVAPDAPLDAWRRFLETGLGSRASVSPASFSVVHNDLAAEHVLVDEPANAVTGVIDWSDVAIADRAIDLAGIFHWGGAAFLESVLSAYDGAVDDGLIARARYFAGCRGVLDVQFGLERDRREYIEAGLRALRMAAGTEKLRT